MRKVRLVADSSADIYAIDGVEFATAPLKICTSEREFVDNEALDTEVMVKYLDGYKGRSTTSCPNAEDWLSAFGGADDIFCVTITSFRKNLKAPPLRSIGSKVFAAFMQKKAESLWETKRNKKRDS
jgi:hypothetical protein